MIKKLKHLFSRWWLQYQQRPLYVIADPADNSISFSRRLFKRMDVMKLDVAKVMVFTVADINLRSSYAFCVNPPLDEPTQLADIQYNSKHKTIGFESLVPTVNRIFYDYGLPHDRKVKLSVSVENTPLVPELCSQPVVYYIIHRPNDITTG